MKFCVLAWFAFASMLLGCGAQQRESSARYPAYSPPPAPTVASAPAGRPLPSDAAGPFGLEVQADRAIGRMGAPIALLREMVETARRDRDVVKFNCLQARLTEVEHLEHTAGERKSAMRDALLDDDERASSELRALQTLERDAARVALEARQCVGEELAFAQRTVLAGAPSVRAGTSSGKNRIRALEPQVDQLKEQTRRAHARTSLLSDIVLSGKAPADTDHDAVADVVDRSTGPTDPSPPATQAAARPTGRHDPSMLLRTAQLTLAVFEVDKNIDAVNAAASQVGGYLAMRGDRQIVVRIPRDRFDEAVRRIEKLGDVLHRNIAAEDVTDQFVDLEMRLRNAQAVRARLEALLANATVHDAVEIHKELAKVTDEIERIEGKLKLLRDRIAWSTITVTFEKVQQQQVRQQALLPFPWMNVLGLSPLLSVPR